MCRARFDPRSGRLLPAALYGLIGIIAIVMFGATRSVGAQTAIHLFQQLDTTPVNPDYGLTRARNGSLYGVSVNGGSLGEGCIFRVASSGAVSTVYSFSLIGPPSGTPSGPLTQGADGALYGATTGGYGTMGGYGTLYRLALDGSLTVVANLDYPLVLPVGTLTALPDGSLLGLVWNVLPSGGVGVYRFKLGSAPTLVCAFGSNNSNYPVTTLTEAPDGNFYLVVATWTGGRQYTFELARVSPAGAITYVCKFPFAGSWPDAGATPGYGYPQTGLTVGPDGRLYGVLGTSPSVAYAVTTSGTVTVLHQFTSAEGWEELSPLARRGNAFIGTLIGQPGHPGTVFAMSTSGAVTILHQFSGSEGTPGAAPVTVNPDGSVIGINAVGGAFDIGEIWRVSASGLFSVMHDLRNGAGLGWYPQSGITAGPGGAMYLSLGVGGAAGLGCVDKLDRTGAVTPVLDYTGMESGPPAYAPCIGADGLVYTASGQYVFVTTPTGSTRTIGALAPFTAGSTPFLAVDGSLYGEASGGPLGDGAIYRISSGSGFRWVHQFQAGLADLAMPTGGLAQDPAGNLFGVAQGGGVNTFGGVFEVNPSGTVSIVHAFNLPQFQSIYGFTRDKSGALLAPAADMGELMKIEYGRFTLLAEPRLKGAVPAGPLLLADTGSLYGLIAFEPSGGGGVGGAGVGTAGGGDTVARISPDGTASTTWLINTLVYSESPGGSLCEVDGDLYAASSSWYPPNGSFDTFARGAVVRLNQHLHDHDYVGNGQTDIMFRNTFQGTDAFWEMNGTHEAAGHTIVGVPGLPWRLVCSCDMNFDGMPDLIFYNPVTGAVRTCILKNQRVVSSGIIASHITPDLRPVCTVDIDGTDDPYLLWQRRSTGTLVFWHLQGAAILDTGVIPGQLSPQEQLEAGGVFYPGDTADLLFRNTQTGDVTVRSVTLAGLTSEFVLATGVTSGWHVGGAAYVTGNNVEDVIWFNGATGSVVCWPLAGNGMSPGIVLGTVAGGWVPEER